MARGVCDDEDDAEPSPKKVYVMPAKRAGVPAKGARRRADSDD